MNGGRHALIRNLWIAALLLIVAGTILILAISIQNDRTNAERTAMEELLFNTALSATRLNSILLAADARLATLTYSGSDIAEALNNVALGIPQASNIYALDEHSHVLATAYSRNEPKLELDQARLLRFGQGAKVDYRMVQAPNEGGTALALIRQIAGESATPHFAVALFTGPSIHGTLDAITSKSYTSVRLLDAAGASLSLGNETNPPNMVGQEIALDDVPLRVRFETDPAIFLAPWRTRTTIMVSIVLVFALMVGALLAYSLIQWNRAVKARELQRQLEHQESLFREVNHRIKNNLAIVQTVLNFGADRIHDYPESAAQTIEMAIGRVRAIAMLHELLYRVPSSSREDFGLYIEALAQAIQDAYGMRDRVTVRIDSDSGLNYSLDHMVPLALILNELLTNAFKYAFPGDRAGIIEIHAKRRPDGYLALTLSDDGVGMTKENAPCGGIGTLLIETLASQLKAVIERDSDRPAGFAFTLLVPPCSGGGA
ncbi:MAG TPA: sensor histidine kinase [bacterium]|nr:sensor histidine kinase [bacterium]